MKVKRICQKCEKFECFCHTYRKNPCEFFTDVTNTYDSFTSVKDSHEFFTSVIRSHDMCDKFIKKSIYNAFIFAAAYLPKHNNVLRKEMLRRHPVVLKETRNRADMKVSVTVESEFILSLKGNFHSNAPSSF